MKNPQISIIIPIFNVESYLSRCINSILLQTFTNFELLLINDGSSDDSGNICNEYARRDNRIKVFHKRNGGVGSARNLGLDNARGEWITFCDSDDWVEKDWLESYVDEIKNNPDILFQGYIYEYPTKSYAHCINRRYNEYIKNIFLLEKEDLFGWTWNKLFKSEIIKQYNLRFNCVFNINEDLLFTLQYCSHAYSISILPITKYHYIIHQNSLTQKIHQYKELLKKNNLIKEARLTLANRDGIFNEYITWINEKYYSGMIGCLKAIYKIRPLPNISERKKLIAIIDQLKYPKCGLSKTDKLLVKIVNLFSYSTSDCILRFFLTIQRLL